MKRIVLFISVLSLCTLCACGGVKKQSVEFSNIQGTETTICSHNGCENFIAPSGDTLFCTEHSARCGFCGCYIDEGKTYCSKCIIEKLDSAPETDVSDQGYEFFN